MHSVTGTVLPCRDERTDYDSQTHVFSPSRASLNPKKSVIAPAVSNLSAAAALLLYDSVTTHGR